MNVLFCQLMDRISIMNRGKKSIPENELLTVTEVAAYLRVTPVTVWRWCQRGIIPAFQVGRVWRIRQVDLLSLTDDHTTEEK
jgi:excisionase family DNA binding protein